MSSLRLALKQSLQEAGLSGDDADVSGKKRRKKNRSKSSLSGLTREQQQEKKQRQKMKKQKKRESANSGRSNSSPGEKKRGPGRPRKHPRPDDEDGHDDHDHDDHDHDHDDHTPKKRGPGRPRKIRATNDAGDNDDHHDDHYHEDDHHDDHDHRRKDRHDDDDDDGHSSSENEFSSSSGEEEEDTDDDTDDDGSDDGSDDDDEEEEGKDEGEEGRKLISAVKSSSSSRDEHQDGITPNDDRHHPSVSSHGHRAGDAGDHDDYDGDDGMTEEELRRKKRKILKKKLKHSAANKIQSQWKKKKAGREEDDDTQTSLKDDTSQRKASSPSKGKKPESSTGEGHDDSIEKKKMSKKKRHGIVDKPIPEIVEWHRNMSDKRCRKHIATGMRVKVRFAVPVKREGKTIKKKTWYGGRVTAVSKMGSKIRIKYDDGTSEVSGFPDEDIVVDCDDNGEHSVSADRFLPPEMRQGYQGNDERRPSLATVDSAAAESKTTVASAEETTEAAASMEVETVSVPSKDHGGDDVKQSEEISPKTSNDDSPEKPTANPAFHIQEIKDEGASKRTDITESNNPTTPTTHPSNSMDTSAGERHGTKTVQNTLGSPEEGELSPGMTVKKDEPSQHEELKIATSPVTMEIDDGMTKATVNADLSMTELKETSPPSKTDPIASTTEEGEVSPQSQLTEPLPGHKLTVDIPIENITKETVSPKPSPRMEKIVSKNSDGENVTTGTSVEANSLKRKREGPEDETDEKEAPPKQKIKLKIPVPKPAVTTTTGIEPKVGIEITEKNDTQDSPDVEMSVEATKPVPMQSSATKEEDENVETPKPAFAPTEPSKSSMQKDVAQSDNDRVPYSSKSVDVEISNESAGMDVKSPEEHSTSEERVVEKKQEESKSQLSAPSTRTEATPLVTSTEKDLKKTTVPAPETSQEKAPEIAGLPESLGSGVDDQITSLKKTKSNESFNAIAARGGRKAAMEAMEKMIAKDKKEKNPALEEKKKKRKPKDDADASEDKQDWVNEMEWVQCDSCHKWRVLPSNVKVSDLPNKWYCNLNVYDPKRNTCDAPEQTAKQALKELKRAKKRARRLEQLQAEKEAASQGELGQESEMKTVSAEIAPIKAPVKAPVKTPVKGQVSPKPSSKQVAKVALKSKDSTEPKKEDNKEQSNSGSEDRKVEKKKRGKKGKIAQKQQQQQQQQPPPAPAPETDETLPAESTEPVVEPPKKKRRGRPPRNTSGSSQGSSENADNVEWVQCEQCSKWRKLPADLSADELPDVWVCSMNTWNTSVASCKAAEETTDAQHQEVGTSEWQLRQTHAGKYSYRAMIFGTGAKKQNRPMSERSRAAESLFQSPDDDERPYPICMYSKSSMFLPRTSNFHKSQLADDKSTSVFGVLSDSNMFSELRDMHLKPPVPDAYTSLGRPGKISMSDLVLDVIGDNAFTGDQIVAFAKATQVGQMATYCNTDIIVNTLLSLVKDGVLEMSCLDPSIPMQQWVPQFRRTRTPRARQIVDKIKSSSNIKISKPWKRRATEQEWVTGGNAS